MIFRRMGQEWSEPSWTMAPARPIAATTNEHWRGVSTTTTTRMPTSVSSTALKMTETTRGNFDTSYLTSTWRTMGDTTSGSTTTTSGFVITDQPLADTTYAESTRNAHLTTGEFFRDTTPSHYDAGGHAGGFGFWTPENTAEAVVACAVVTCAACGCVAAYCVCRARARERERDNAEDGDAIEMQQV